jgi:hypothetical protein
VEGQLQGDSIYKVTLIDHGDSVSGSAPERIARGLRNPAGFAFHPLTGDLYFEDNGIDGLVDPDEPLSADELNLIARDDIGGDVEDFGFPENYIRYRTGEFVGGQGIPPLVTFEPLPDPSTGSESEGPSEISFGPPGFPAELRGGIFIGFHGRFNLGGIANEENPLVYVDLETLEYFHFVANDEPGVGHLDGLLAVGDSLFVADLAASGSVSTGAGSGAIYQVKYLGPPPPRFLRGDANGDGAVDLTDAVATLELLFLSGGGIPCLDAADANDDGEVDIADPVAILFHLFEGGTLPPPFPEVGSDPTPDGLGCPSS